MAKEPRIRAAVTKDLLETLAAQPAASTRSKPPPPPPELTLGLDQVIRVGWVPLSQHMAINEHIRGRLGTAGYRQLWRTTMRRLFEQPTLKTLVDGAIRFFGLNPVSMMKVTPRGWGFLFRDAGRIVFRVCATPDEGDLVLEDFPTEHLKSGTFVEGLAGCFESYLDVCGVQGAVAISEDKPAQGRAAFHLGWGLPGPLVDTQSPETKT